SLSTALLLAGALPGVLGHTWIEQLRNIDAQGNYVGEFGYPRGMYSKTDPGYDGDKMNHQVPSVKEKSFPFISADSPLCHPAQRKPEQSSDKYPRLKTAPGQFIAMRYMENGHITKPETRLGKPDQSGPVYIYGTTQPKEDEKLANVLQWTADGQGGDKRGVLLTVNNYDDGRCYEINDKPISKERQAKFPNYAAGQVSDGPGNYPLFCESNVAIPKDAAVGKPYTLYWVWQWNTVPGVDPGLPKGQDEYYTTCMDVDVVDVIQQGAKAQLGLVQQDAMSVAPDGFRSRTAVITDAMSFEMGPVFNTTRTATGSVPSVTMTQTTLVTSSGAPFQNSTASLQIPTLTKRPGDVPTATPTDGDDVVRITVTQRVTVTAPAVTAT
ncbi:uncharacterized protein EI97DRAFT_345050, partial [Westerdykella ornata]